MSPKKGNGLDAANDQPAKTQKHNAIDFIANCVRFASGEIPTRSSDAAYQLNRHSNRLNWSQFPGSPGAIGGVPVTAVDDHTLQALAETGNRATRRRATRDLAKRAKAAKQK